ncbi:MAG: ABC transporter permease, partial [Firmicutes bacterium]|nr:ABC transporter permease [Bacillota bacterium]
MRQAFNTRQYLSIFRLRMNMGLQYRIAALAAMSTHFVWGCMEILMFHAFYRSNPAAFPMSLPAIAAYVWFQQAF